MRRTDVLFLTAMIVTVAAVAGGLWFQSREGADGAATADAVPTGPNIGGPFMLVDQNGTAVTERDLLGHYSIVFFGYTSCPDVCPIGLNRITETLEQLGARGDKIVPYFFSIDPARDTPAALKEFAEHFHPRLRYLTGSEEQVQQAATAYKVYRKLDKRSPDDMEYVVDHTSLIYVLGPDGKYAAHFSHGTPVQDMVARLKRLV